MVSIVFSEECAKDFAGLKRRADKGDGESKYLLDIIEKGVAKLALNPEAGKHIPKRLWPKEYVQKYVITNLWKINLDGNWRMPYTLRGSQAEIIGFILEFLDHKNYDRKFGYKTS